MFLQRQAGCNVILHDVLAEWHVRERDGGFGEKLVAQMRRQQGQHVPGLGGIRPARRPGADRIEPPRRPQCRAPTEVERAERVRLGQPFDGEA